MLTTTRKVQVQEIPVLFQANPTVVTNKIVVAAYARVSTESEEQEDSFERQVEHYTQFIKSHPEWEFGGVYPDHGITGTRAEVRPQFLKLIEDCRAGKINKVLVKSISRFARNTVDSLTYIRELKELGISIYFENENIDTLTPGGEVLITILSAIAEQESRNMSTNIKWGFNKKFKNGEVIINCHGTLGYAKQDDEYVIVPEEAEIVQRIYREFISGKSLGEIAVGLTEDGIKTPLGKDEWHSSTVQNILTNERYSGNAILGKTYKPDVLSKGRRQNEGQAPMFRLINSHPAIVSEDTFNIAQAELERRKQLRSNVNTGAGKYSAKYPLGMLLVCSNCGSKFRRFGRKLADGTKVPTWVCIQHQKESGKCDMLPLKESDVYEAYKRAVERLSGDFDEIIATVKQNADEILNGDGDAEKGQDAAIMEYQQRILELFKAHREDRIGEEEYAKLYQEYSDTVRTLEAERDRILSHKNELRLARHRLQDIAQILSDRNRIDVANPSIIKILVERITVLSKTQIEIVFKCGIKIKETII